MVDLGQLFQQACDEAAIDLSIDYSQPPSPGLTDEDTAWIKTLQPG